MITRYISCRKSSLKKGDEVLFPCSFFYDVSDLSKLLEGEEIKEEDLTSLEKVVLGRSNLGLLFDFSELRDKVDVVRERVERLGIYVPSQVNPEDNSTFEGELNRYLGLLYPEHFT